MQNLWLLPVLVVVVTVMLRGFLLNRPEEYPVEVMDSGWVIERNGVRMDTGTLTQFLTGDVKYGETFVITRTLPAEEEIPSACIYFRNLHSAISVSLDGTEIYSSGRERYEDGRMVARILCFVPLPAGHCGKELSITVIPAEENAFYGLGPVWYGVEQDLFTRMLKERQYAFYIATFLSIFGIIQLCWLPFLMANDRANVRLLFSSLTTLVLGVYLFGYYNLFDLFTQTENLNTILEYLSLYLVAACISGYFTTISSGRLKRIYQVFVVADLAFVSLTLLLHVLNIVHIIRFLFVSYIISFSETIPFFASVLTGWHRRRKTYFDKLEENADRVLAAGFFAFVIGSFIDAAIFTIVRSTGGQESVVRIPFITAGSLVYAFAVCMHYFLHGVVNLRAEATRQRLKDKAYSDPLTGLSNRGECEMVLDRLSRDHSRFCIISFDLDNLKKMNDTYGHAEGDRMLCGFADILRTAFAGSTLIGRMGGDEFLVILTGDDCDTAEDRLKQMQRLMDEQNEKEARITYSASHGIARNGDGRFGRRAHDVYMLADARMYDMKRRHK